MMHILVEASRAQSYVHSQAALAVSGSQRPDLPFPITTEIGSYKA